MRFPSRPLVRAAALLAAAFSAGASPAQPPAKPRLVVVVSIDQFRGDYIHRFDRFFGEDGFRRIAREGFVYEQALYPTANTETGPGHSQLLTGAFAHRSGISQNEWFDAATGRPVYCVADADTTLTGGAGAGVSARNLLAGTAGDNLEVATGGQARTVSLSLKDRAAILMGGHAADRVLWFDRRSGAFISSRFYGESLPAWVEAFNAAKPADAWFKKDWTLSLPAGEYAAICTADDFPQEKGPRNGYVSNVFPHTLGARSDAPDANYYTGVYTSPFGNDLLLALAEKAIAEEKLGADAVPDLLTISFSSNDPIGHAFGPDSWEVMDTTIKTDKLLAELMGYLDKNVGAGQWSLLLTADHGVCSCPEALQARNIDAGRVNPNSLRQPLEALLREKLGPPAAGRGYVADFGIPWVAFAPAAFGPDGAEKRKQAAALAAGFLAAQEVVVFAEPVSDLLARASDGDRLLKALKISYFPGRCGDVALVLKPNYLLDAGSAGTGHGSPWNYDQHVPVLAIGAGLRNGAGAEQVAPAQVAPTAAILLGVNPPNLCEVPALVEALAQPK
jgi:hypothetical protein